MIDTFTGFRGHATLLEIGKVKFMVLCKSPRDLAAVYSHVMPHAEPFDQARCKRAIIIEAKILPTKHEPAKS